MTQAHPKFGLPMTTAEYAAEWQRSADAFSSAGHYRWMNEQLGQAERVVEIGCGSGASTEALVAAGRKVLSIESNQPALQSAISHLRGKGLDVDEMDRGQWGAGPPWAGAVVKLVNRDLFDTELDQFLPGQSFDAIVCWMTGTHPEHIAQRLEVPYMEFDTSHMAEYRKKVQTRAYALGQKILKRAGVVQVVDRAAIRSWSDKDQMRTDLAAAQAELSGQGFAIAKTDCFLRKLTDGLSQSSIQYVAHVPATFEGVLVLTSSKARLV